MENGIYTKNCVSRFVLYLCSLLIRWAGHGDANLSDINYFSPLKFLLSLGQSKTVWELNASFLHHILLDLHFKESLLLCDTKTVFLISKYRIYLV